jgi:hypothetical protein
VKVTSDPARCHQDAESKASAVVQAGDGPGLVPLQDVDQLRQPLFVVDGDAFGRVEAQGCQPQDDMRQVVEAVADFFARHVTDGRREQAAGNAEKGQQVAAHAGPPCGRRRPEAGGRYRSLSAASWMRAAVTAAPVIA